MNDYGRLNACNYYVVCGWFVSELHLKGLELELFSIIYGFSQAKGSYKGTLKYLEDWTSASNSGVRKTLISLEEKGLITKTSETFNNVIYNEYRVSENLLGEGALLSDRVRYSVTGCATECRGAPLSNGNDNNKTNNKDKLILEKEEIKEEVSPYLDFKNKDIRDIYDTFDDKTKDAVNEWLKYKKERKNKYTPIGLKQLLTKLKKDYESNGAEYVQSEIYSSIINNYQGIFPPKFGNGANVGNLNLRQYKQSELDNMIDDIDTLEL